jgi:predicted Zn-dependent protease with MMP-like domain
VEPRRRTRDRRDRGLRGPAVQPRPGARLPRGSKREQFDALVLRVVTDVDERWSSRLGLVEYAVEDAPQVPDDWTGSVPLSSLVRGSATPTRLVLFRRPIEHRAETRADLEALVLTVVVEQVAELLGIEAHEVDPRYGREE